jgi:PmbA protein
MSQNMSKSDTLNNDLELAQFALQKLTSLGAEKADVLISAGSSMSVSCRLGELEDVERSESRDIGLRAIFGKSQAFVSATGASKEAIETLAERAVAMAQNTPEDPFCDIVDAQDLAKTWPDLDLFDTYEPEIDELREKAMETEAIARGFEGITNSEGAGASWGRGATILATSNGFSGAYESSSFSLSCAVLGGVDDAMERDYASHSVRHNEALDTPETVGRKAAERTLARLNPRKVKSTKVPVMFDTRVSASILGHLIGAISGGSIARGTSFLRNDLGKTIMRDDIQIMDEPHRKRGLRSAAFDGEGMAMETLQLVENGVLKTWILDSSTAKQLNLKSNGRAGRGIGSPPSPSATNLYMKAGDKTPEEMMREIGTGLFVTELIGMGVNGVTGDYSRGASGFWIENGELAYPVSEITIASNLREIFSLMHPANDLTFRHGVNAPSLMIEEMSLAGI